MFLNIFPNQPAIQTYYSLFKIIKVLVGANFTTEIKGHDLKSQLGITTSHTGRKKTVHHLNTKQKVVLYITLPYTQHYI